MYSFSLNSTDFQPSGSCDFSRIDTAELIFSTKYNFINEVLYLYAINYNILVVSSGMAGLLYN